VWALLIAALAGPAELAVTVRAPAGAEPECTVTGHHGAAVPGRLTRPRVGHWLWTPAPGQSLTCQSPGLEPVDVDGSRDGPRAIVVDLLPSRPLVLEGGPPGAEALVEWRELGQGATRLLAKRRVTLGDALTLPVATGAHRVLRVRARGRSPVSLFLPAGATPSTIRLPPLRPGGEVFGVVPTQSFVPEILALDGSGMRLPVRTPPSGLFQADGIAPGPHTLVPIYRGGLAGKPLPVTVRAGETTELLPLPLPQTGAVSVRVRPELCGAERLPLRIGLKRVRDEGRAVDARAFFEQTVEEPSCDREWEGLDEGTYQVSLTRAGETAELLSSSRFGVRRNQRAQASLSTLPVHVSGRVTYGADRPAAGLLVWFELDAQTWSAATDASGEYALSLGAPGAYVVSVRTAKGLPSHTVVRTLPSGEQRLDLAMSEASLDVRVVRPAGSAPGEVVQLSLTAGGGRRLSGTTTPEEEGTARFVGLAFDEYFVTARTASGLTSVAAARVELTPDQPAGEVEVVLGRHRGRLRVTDERGQPLAQSQVSAGVARLAASAPGLFPLEGVPAGEWLKVRAAGYAPLCRVLDPKELPEVRVVLPQASDSLRLHFASQLPWESGMLLGLPGSDCPVEMADLGTVTSLGDNRTTVLLRVPRGQYQFAMGSARYPLVVPGQDVYIR
jgi:hypothetical protein